MPWWRRNRPAATDVSLLDPTLHSIRVNLDGWNEQVLTELKDQMRLWTDSEESAITVTVLRGHPVTCDAMSAGWRLQHWTRDFARDSSGGLIEAGPVQLPFGPALRFIFKTLERPAYMYHGQLVFAHDDADIMISIVCKELGTTGIREAVITDELLAQGRLDPRDYERVFARDPYDPCYDGVDRSVLRFMSDDAAYDSRFPDHPLSKVRRLLTELPAAISFGN